MVEQALPDELGSVEDRFRAIVHDGAWLHVGDAEGLAAAKQYFKAQ